MNITPLQVTDLDDIVNIHLAAFPKSALTLLGKEAVRRYYEWQLTGPHQCLAIGAVDDSGRIAGFCFGGVFHGALSGFVEKNKKFLVLQVLQRPWLVFTNPIFRDRLSLGIRVSRNRVLPLDQESKNKHNVFGILAIAVDQDLQGKGIGQLLMRYSETYAIAQGFTQMRLTVARDNHQAIHFYEMNDWYKEINSNGWTGTMIKDLELRACES